MDNDQTHISVPNSVGDELGGNEQRPADKPMTASQASHLKSLAAELGLPVDLNLTGREAMKKIEELERKAGRGAPKDS
jgi:hypothetical protein